MEVSKGKKIFKSKALTDITNEFSKKPIRKRKSKKHSKASSDFKFENIGYTNENIFQQKEFYLSLKESQILSLSSALTLNTERIKRRYKLLKIKLGKQQKRKSFIYSRLVRMTPTPDLYQKNSMELSPISLCETQSTTSSLMGYVKSIEAHEYSTFNKKFINLDDLKYKNRMHEEESGKVIEQEFYIKEKLKALSMNKQELIIKFGKIYERKKNIGRNREEIRKIMDSNCGLREKVEILKGILQKLRAGNNLKRRKKTTRENENKQKHACINNYENNINSKKNSIQTLQKSLSDKLESIKNKEIYINDVFSIKTQVFDKFCGKVSQNGKLNKTKDSTMKALSKL